MFDASRSCRRALFFSTLCGFGKTALCVDRRIWSSMDTCKRSHATVTMGAAHPTCIPCSKAVKKAQSSAKGGLRPFAEPRGGS